MGRMFHVTVTERGQMFGLISARKANKRAAQRRYEQWVIERAVWSRQALPKKADGRLVPLKGQDRMEEFLTVDI